MDCQIQIGRGNREWDIFVLLSPYFPYHISLSVLKPIAALRVSHCTHTIIFVVFYEVITADKNVSGKNRRSE
jgi:hypothetical protein